MRIHLLWFVSTGNLSIGLRIVLERAFIVPIAIYCRDIRVIAPREVFASSQLRKFYHPRYAEYLLSFASSTPRHRRRNEGTHDRAFFFAFRRDSICRFFFRVHLHFRYLDLIGVVLSAEIVPRPRPRRVRIRRTCGHEAASLHLCLALLQL